MNRSLLEKYGDARLPRYTSYPTAPRFSPAIDADTYGRWLAGLPAETRASLYVHVPFCREMCWYCGCHTSVTRRDGPVDAYLDTLMREAGLVAAAAPQGLAVDEVHFGGGTPTIMSPQAFAALMACLRARFGLHAATRIAIEIDPRTLTPAMTECLGREGVTRASLGVQSFDVTVQKAINRVQSERQTLRAVEGLRENGIARINFDLIYGLPHQTVQSCVETAQAAAAMRPDRLAVFGYAHVPGFKKHQRLIDEAALPDAAHRDAQARAMAETLVGAGYVAIGLDHFALPEDELAKAAATGGLRRNFQGYTTDAADALIGLGASAIGRLPQGYVQNAVPVNLYTRAVHERRLAVAKGCALSGDDHLRAAIIERLMCDFSADVGAIARAHGADPAMLLTGNARLDALCEDGAVSVRGAVVSVAREYRFMVRAAAACFDAYLDQAAQIHSRAA